MDTEGVDPMANANDIHQMMPSDLFDSAVRPPSLFAASSIAHDGGRKSSDSYTDYSVAINQSPHDNMDSLLIFGGSSSFGNPAEFCSKALYSFNLPKKTWSRVQPGPCYPTHRYSHSFAVIDGLQLVHESPFTYRDTKPYRDQFDWNRNSRVVVCFGGVHQYKTSSSEVWLLDPEGRDPRYARRLLIRSLYDFSHLSPRYLLLYSLSLHSASNKFFPSFNLTSPPPTTTTTTTITTTIIGCRITVP